MTPIARSTGWALAHDERGAIAVIGVFMAAFLTGILWYVVATANAILYRERVQDAADAVVFAAAVYHARGMNIIVTLNIVMAALLGLLVASRLLRYLVDTAAVISCACIPVPFIGGVCGSVCGAARGVQPNVRNLERTLTNLYNNVGPVLSKTQTGVALAMPWIAEVRAIQEARAFRPDVRFGAIASFSLVKHEDRLGLPVQEGDASVLCDKVQSGLVNIVLGPLDFISVPGWGFIRDRITDPLEGFVGRFCDGGELVDQETVEQLEQDAEDEQVEDRCDWEERVSRALRHPTAWGSPEVIAEARLYHAQGEADVTTLQCYSDQRHAYLADLPGFGAYRDRDVPGFVTAVPDVEGPPPCSFDQDTCEERARAEIRELQEAERRQGGGPAGDIGEAREKTTPKVVFSDARNGNKYFQVWSVVYANDDRATAPARGVELAGWGRPQVGGTSLWGRLGWAQAEFYYDHEGAWSEDISVKEAMWNLRWRARLRRVFRPGEIEILQNASGQILDRLSGFITGGDEEGEGPSDVIDVLVNLAFEGAMEDIRQRVNDLAVTGDNAIERRAQEAWYTIGGVH